MNVLEILRQKSKGVEGLSARSILNYVIYEFEVGGPSKEILEEALRLASKEIEQLQKVIEILKDIEVYV
ncbi:hypothetical protein [Thermoproteus tenax]|uniref:Uncharacterized protein n=1 Tax=Thermoproteus tenax (strain ATCC 35583 / DSM 2078 / JCM 9277 / NBRC 100435 / Kra 1) TaxID=768679 RepID=G4RPH2_THETK|nr:hypothetical protein [Thermoproteus tenax]CCC81467.1 conserved hypothetical protein [Thermoproteus tenax Kra 1]